MINEAFFSLNLLSYIIKTTHYTLAVLVQTHLSDDFFFWPITAACLLVTKTQRGKAESSMFMFSLVLYQFCSHLIGAEIASNAASAQLSVKQRAWLKENGPGWPCSLGNGLWARRGVPIETSLPSQTSSFALGCACCQKRGRQCALGTVGSPGVHIHLGSFLLASAPTHQSPMYPRLKAKHIIVSTDWIQMCVRHTLSLFPSPSCAPPPLTQAQPCSIFSKCVYRCRHITQTRVHTKTSLLHREKESFKVQGLTKQPLGRAECFQGDGWALLRDCVATLPNLKWLDQIDFRQMRQLM